MPLPSALIVSVDGLHSGFVGPYGNTWVRTPNLDALAAQSFVFDQALIAHPSLARVCDAFWTVLRRDAGSAGEGEPASLAQVVAQAGVETLLATDDPAVLEHPRAAGFARRVLLPSGEPRADHAADEVGETELAQACLAAADCLREARAPFFVWIHLRGLTGPWDAPQELREQYADPEDPPTPRFVAVPDVELPADPDPDEVLGMVHAYAGQVTLVDTCLDVLREALAEHPAAGSAVFSLIGARGFPLGEHGRIGGSTAPLYSELLQIPWFWQLPGGAGALERSSALVQQQDLAATLLAWWGLDGDAPQEQVAGNRSRWAALAGGQSVLPLVAGERAALRDRIYLAGESGEELLRTAAWLLRSAGSDANSRVELFAKPGDRWDVNEVADRAPHIAEALAAALAACRAARPGETLPPLGAELTEPID